MLRNEDFCKAESSHTSFVNARFSIAIQVKRDCSLFFFSISKGSLLAAVLGSDFLVIEGDNSDTKVCSEIRVMTMSLLQQEVVWPKEVGLLIHM